MICTASVQESVPRWMVGQGRGWLTSEYGMLPASTGDRKQRDVTKGRPDGRTVEIQRLIGRSLRGVVDFKRSASARSTSTATSCRPTAGRAAPSITGGYVALELACRRLVDEGKLKELPLNGSVAAVSCGIVDGTPLLDLDYPEDSTAEVDANVVMTGEGGLDRGAGDRRAHAALAGEPRRAARARPARHREPARDPGRRRPLTPPWDCCWPPATRTSCGSSRGCCRARRSTRCPTARRSPPEDGETYADNALIKARAAAAAAGRAAIADDSGIEAEALGGAPGVHTARYAGPDATDEENLARFCAEVPAGSALRYVCVIAHVTPDGAETLFEGTCAGTMAAERAGDGGFGYDPVFVPEGETRTMAELSDGEKDAISHRGLAARALQAWLPT